MTLELSGPLLVAGAGKMGGALIERLLARGLNPALIRVQDPAPAAEVASLLARHGIAAEAEISALPSPPAIILAAVKPQVMDQVFAPLGRLAGPDTLVLSIAAGRSIASFERLLPPATAVIRAMPNTPAQVGRGVTACFANASTTERHRALADALLSAVGSVVWLHSEADMDAVTAVSGSGPAYVFYMVECLAQAGRDAGLAPDLADALARATISGAGELLHQSSADPATLRKNVTSPGGTTAAALAVLMEAPGLAELMKRAVAAAAQRSRELSG